MMLTYQDCSINYDNSKYTVTLQGSLRLNDMVEYTKIKQFLIDIYSLDTPSLTLDFSGLEFLNSAGISTILKFIFEVKEEKVKPLTIIGNKGVLWQVKSFENFRKILNLSRSEWFRKFYTPVE